MKKRTEGNPVPKAVRKRKVKSATALVPVPRIVDSSEYRYSPPPPAQGDRLFFAKFFITFFGLILLFVLVGVVFNAPSSGSSDTTPLAPSTQQPTIPATDDVSDSPLRQLYDQAKGNDEETQLINRMFAKGLASGVRPDQDVDFIIRTFNAIHKHQIFIGMPEKAVRLSWGSPNDVNQETTALGTTKQLVYDDGYVYINEDGIVYDIQH